MDDITEAQREAKAQAVQKELQGLNVEYGRYGLSYGLTPDMAKVNGHSIIWHSAAYADPSKPEVEVMWRNENDVEGYVPIKGLRERVEQ